jgi:hypothetical protein
MIAGDTENVIDTDGANTFVVDVMIGAERSTCPNTEADGVNRVVVDAINEGES